VKHLALALDLLTACRLIYLVIHPQLIGRVADWLANFI
jgi:hypothetical protein